MRRRGVLAALLAFALPTARATTARAQDASVVGTLQQVDTAAATILIRTEQGARRGRYTPTTIVTVDGMAGDVRDLRPGQQVRLQFAVDRNGAARDEIVRIDVRARRRG